MPEFQESSNEKVVGVEISDDGEAVVVETSVDGNDQFVEEVNAEDKSAPAESAASKANERYALKRGRLPQTKKSMGLASKTVAAANVVDVTNDAIGSRSEVNQKPRTNVQKTTEVVDDANSVDGENVRKNNIKDIKKPTQARQQNVSSKRVDNAKFSGRTQCNKKRSKLSKFLEAILRILGIKRKNDVKQNFKKHENQRFSKSEKNYRPRRRYGQNGHSKKS